MTAFIVIVAVLGLLVLVGAAILIPYLGGMAAGRVAGWVFDVKPEDPARQWEDRLSPEELAEIDELLARTKPKAPDA